MTDQLLHKLHAIPIIFSLSEKNVHESLQYQTMINMESIFFCINFFFYSKLYIQIHTDTSIIIFVTEVFRLPNEKERFIPVILPSKQNTSY